MTGIYFKADHSLHSEKVLLKIVLSNKLDHYKFIFKEFKKM